MRVLHNDFYQTTFEFYLPYKTTQLNYVVCKHYVTWTSCNREVTKRSIQVTK